MQYIDSKYIWRKLLFCTLCGLYSWVAQAQIESVSKGDVIDINGVKALVFKISEDGHGTAIAVKAIRGRKDVWCSKGIKLSMLKMDDEDGIANTNAIFDFVKTNKLSISMFPAFEWCQVLGEGWYIPSAKELKEFVDFYLGNEQEFGWDDEADTDLVELSPKIINERIIDAGGQPFSGALISGNISAGGVFTSTKTNEGKILVYQFNEKNKTFQFKEISPKKLDTFTTGRAFFNF